MSISELDESQLDEGCLPSGIKEVDENYTGGLPKGSVIAVITEPRSVGEQVLYSLAKTQRKTHYISTLRKKSNVEDDIRKFLGADETPEFVKVKDTVSAGVEPEQKILKQLDRVEDEENFIVDSFSNLYSEIGDRKDHHKIVREIEQYTKDTNSITYLHFAVNDIHDLKRHESEVLNMCDGVCFVGIDSSGSNIETYLEFTKLRDSRIPDERVTLLVGETLSVDTTRDIA